MKQPTTPTPTTPTNRSLRANLWKLYVLSALRASLLVMPVLVPFYRAHGMSLRDVFWLQGLFGLVILVLEVPSGWCSDRLGRRRTILVGYGVAAFGMAVYPVAEGFYGFLLAEVLLGVGFSCLSGTDTALTWETLEALGTPGRYGRVLGRQRFLANLAEGAASVAGAALAVVCMRLPLLVEALLYAATLPVALTLVEPGGCRGGPRARPHQGPLRLLRETLGLDAGLRTLLVFAAFLGVGTLAMAWYTQPWLKLAGFPLATFGVLWAVLRVGSGLSSLIAHRVRDWFGPVGTAWLLVGMIVLGYLGAAVWCTPWAFGFLLLFAWARGVGLVVFSEAVNQRIPSDRRATVLSCQSLIARVMFAPVSPLLGWFADAWGLSVALTLCGLVFGVGASLLLRRWQRAGEVASRRQPRPAARALARSA